MPCRTQTRGRSRRCGDRPAWTPRSRATVLAASETFPAAHSLGNGGDQNGDQNGDQHDGCSHKERERDRRTHHDPLSFRREASAKRARVVGGQQPNCAAQRPHADHALEHRPTYSRKRRTPTTALTRPISDLQAELTEIGEREGAQVRVAPLMEARLTGGGFRITALTTAAKHLTSGR
jgi:hypothetical protein